MVLAQLQPALEPHSLKDRKCRVVQERTRGLLPLHILGHLPDPLPQG